MKYRKRPIEVEAIQFNGTNFEELQQFCGTHRDFGNEVDIQTFNPINTYLLFHIESTGVSGELWVAANNVWLGVVPGEWIIQHTLGFYPCRNEIFNATYEPVQENT